MNQNKKVLDSIEMTIMNLDDVISLIERYWETMWSVQLQIPIDDGTLQKIRMELMNIRSMLLREKSVEDYENQQYIQLLVELQIKEKETLYKQLESHGCNVGDFKTFADKVTKQKLVSKEIHDMRKVTGELYIWNLLNRDGDSYE